MELSAFVSISALIVGIQALFVATFIALTRRDRKRVIEALETARTTRKVMECSHETTIRAVARLHTSLEVHLGILHELINKAELNTRPRFKKEILGVKRRNEKSLLELALFCENEITRESAYRSLSMSLGDLKSLEIMRRVSLLRDDSQLRKAIERLQIRLEEDRDSP